MRVLHIASGDLWGGAEYQLWTLAKSQRDAGHVVSVVLLNRGVLAERLVSESLSVDILPEEHLRSLNLITSLYRKCRQFRPDVAHTHRTKENILGAIAARLAGVPVCVRTVHGDTENRTRWHQFRRILAGATECAAVRMLHDATCAVSEELGHRLSRRMCRGPIIVVPNGIDPDEVRKRASAGTIDLPAKGIAIRVCAVGRLVAVKRIDLFIDASALLQRMLDRPVEVYVIGDGPLRQQLESYASRYTALTVRFVGFVDNSAAWLSGMDLVVITSDHEGLPMVLLEALALGVRVVSRAVGGIPDVLSDTTRGRLVGSGLSSDIAQAMRAEINEINGEASCSNWKFPAHLAAGEMQTGYQKVYEMYLP